MKFFKRNFAWEKVFGIKNFEWISEKRFGDKIIKKLTLMVWKNTLTQSVFGKTQIFRLIISFRPKDWWKQSLTKISKKKWNEIHTFLATRLIYNRQIRRCSSTACTTTSTWSIFSEFSTFWGRNWEVWKVYTKWVSYERNTVLQCCQINKHDSIVAKFHKYAVDVEHILKNPNGLVIALINSKIPTC